MATDAERSAAAHLLRRAAWGGTPAEIERAAADGIETTVDRILDADLAPTVAEPGDGIGHSRVRDDEFFLGFFHLAATSPTPGIERLMWFWHGHFATSLNKVEFPDLMWTQLMTLRRLGPGRFDDLVKAVTRDTAMNLWLDLHLSIAGSPNENYARELLELFTMGSGNGYTQADVVAAARALTGHGIEWGWDRPLRSTLDPALHDFGPKLFLGRSGSFDGDDVIDIVVGREECHRFVAGRFWTRYAGTEPPDGVIDDLARAFADRLETRDLLRALLTHPRFYDDDVRSGLVAHPVEIVVRAVRGFDLVVADPAGRHVEDLERETDGEVFLPIGLADRMGQLPGLPPNVAGWPHNGAWLDSNRAAGRLVAGTELGHHLAWSETPVGEALRAAARSGDLAAEVLGRLGVVEWSDATAAAIEDAASTPDPGAAVAAAVAVAFTSPEVTLA